MSSLSSVISESASRVFFLGSSAYDYSINPKNGLFPKVFSEALPNRKKPGLQERWGKRISFSRMSLYSSRKRSDWNRVIILKENTEIADAIFCLYRRKR